VKQDRTFNRQRVVVTGLGIISPVGLTASSTWEALISGRSGVDYISSFDPSSLDTKFAAEAKGFDASMYVGRMQAKRSEQFKVLSEMGPRRVSPILAPTMTGDAASVQVSLTLGTKGVNYAPSSACSSGSDAIGQAYEMIRQGNARVMVAGGAEAPIIPLVLAAFGAIRALSTRNDNPQAACRPFDAERD